VSVAVLAFGIVDVQADHHVLTYQRRQTLVAADRAAATRPDSIRYWLVSASAHARVGDLNGAIQSIDRALAISPLDPILLATRGQILLEIADATRSPADIDDVVTFYRQLLDDDPNNGQNQLRAGTAFALAGDLEAAVKAFLAAADLAPTSAVPLANLARVYLASGYIDKAVDAFQQARAVDPDTPGLDEIAALLESAGANIG
jgi:tetratricopeptide (TPR) repeat protein